MFENDVVEWRWLSRIRIIVNPGIDFKSLFLYYGTSEDHSLTFIISRMGVSIDAKSTSILGHIVLSVNAIIQSGPPVPIHSLSEN